MGDIIHFDKYRADPKVVTNVVAELSKKDIYKVEQIRDSIEMALEKVATAAVSYTHLTLPTILLV